MKEAAWVACTSYSWPQPRPAAREWPGRWQEAKEKVDGSPASRCRDQTVTQEQRHCRCRCGSPRAFAVVSPPQYITYSSWRLQLYNYYIDFPMMFHRHLHSPHLNLSLSRGARRSPLGRPHVAAASKPQRFLGGGGQNNFWRLGGRRRPCLGVDRRKGGGKPPDGGSSLPPFPTA